MKENTIRQKLSKVTSQGAAKLTNALKNLDENTKERLITFTAEASGAVTEKLVTLGSAWAENKTKNPNGKTAKVLKQAPGAARTAGNMARRKTYDVLKTKLAADTPAAEAPMPKPTRNGNVVRRKQGLNLTC